MLHSNAEHIPLGAETKIRISKFLFVDVGALLAAQNIPIQSILGVPLEFAHQGVIAEQFVGQHLLYSSPSYKEPELYYWHPPKNEAQAEVDFLLQQNTAIIPVEVKSASTGRIKSLHSYVLKRNAPVAARIHSGRASWERVHARLSERSQPFKLLNLPLYMITSLPRLAAELSAHALARSQARARIPQVAGGVTWLDSRASVSGSPLMRSSGCGPE